MTKVVNTLLGSRSRSTYLEGSETRAGAGEKSTGSPTLIINK